MVKYVFIQDDPFFLPKVLDTYLHEFAESTAGVHIQSVQQGKRSVLQTALDLYKLYGFGYFQWKLRRYAWLKVRAKFFGGASVRSVARKHGIPVTEGGDVNSEEFRAHLRAAQVELIVSISGTQLYKKKLRQQMTAGIINCHGALLPKYRGLMPSFWTLANGEKEGGISVHFVDRKLDNGPIVVQKRYPIQPQDTLEGIMARSKAIAADAILEAVRLIEAGDPPLIDNDEAQATSFSMPTREDARRFLTTGHRFR